MSAGGSGAVFPLRGGGLVKQQPERMQKAEAGREREGTGRTSSNA